MEKILLFGWILIGGLAGGMIQIIFASQEDVEAPLKFGTAFWFVRHFYATYKEELNRVGLIIGVVFITVFILPGSLIFIGILILLCLIVQAFKLFKYIFRKRE